MVLGAVAFISPPQQLFPDVYNHFSELALWVHIDQSGSWVNSSPEKRNNCLVNSTVDERSEDQN